jgi:hypothetical protein
VVDMSLFKPRTPPTVAATKRLSTYDKGRQRPSPPRGANIRRCVSDDPQSVSRIYFHAFPSEPGYLSANAPQSIFGKLPWRHLRTSVVGSEVQTFIAAQRSLVGIKYDTVAVATVTAVRPNRQIPSMGWSGRAPALSDKLTEDA